MWRRIVSYSLFILGFLTITFFRHYSGTVIPHPFLFWLLGLSMFLGGYLVMRYAPSPKEQAAIRQLRQLIGELKTNGEKIMVDLRTCEIREHNYRDWKEPYGSDSLLLSTGVAPGLHHLLNNLEYGSDKPQLSDVTQTVILFQYPNTRTGQTEKFLSPVIPRDRVTLTFYLDQQQQTTLYVDRTNRSLYYFDLDFLK